MLIYALLGRLFPVRPLHGTPQRILLMLPCCIGDVVQGTATLQALRRAYPQAHITWAVGDWSQAAIAGHDLLDAVLLTGPEANPARTPASILRLIRRLRPGRYDLAVSLVRSPLMGLALWLAGIPQRAGLDSAGRGFAYTVRAPIDPAVARHEAEIYLDIARALGLDTTNCYSNLPVDESDAQYVRHLLTQAGINQPYFVFHPGGGSNPGMEMSLKRWPPAHFAGLIARLCTALNAQPVIVAGPEDGPIVAAVQEHLTISALNLTGQLSFGQIAALARDALGYIGNDTGLTHVAAAAGARTMMILGPSDPVRYAPFTPNSMALWKSSALPPGGVAFGPPPGWNWEQHGISVDEAATQALAFLRQQ